MSLPPAPGAAFVAVALGFASCATAGVAIRRAVAASAANSRNAMCMSDSPCRGLREFLGCQRANRKRVDRVRQEVTYPCEDGLMSFESWLSAERLRHDEERKVPAARGSPGVPDVLGAVVVDLELHRSEIGESLTERGRDVHHGRSGR